MDGAARSEPATAPLAMPGDLVLHPVVLGAIGILLLNDHVLKDQYPGALTGKLSDLAGLVFFPVLLVSASEVITTVVTGRRRFVGPRGLAFCLAAVVFVFGVSKIAGWSEGPYEAVTGWLRWPVGAVEDLVGGRAVEATARTELTQDSTDLLALPAVLAAGWLVVRNRGERWQQSSGELDGGGAAGEEVADEVQLEP